MSETDGADSAEEREPAADESTLLGATGVQQEVLADLAHTEAELQGKSGAADSTSAVVDYKPAQYNTVTPYLIVEGAASLIDFIVAVLGGQETLRLPGSDGRIGHAEIRVGDSIIMLADAPRADAVTSTMLHLYVEDADAVYRRAMQRGAVSLREPRDEFYGDRMAGVRDSWGNQWYFATHVKDVSDADMSRRAQELAESER